MMKKYWYTIDFLLLSVGALVWEGYVFDTFILKDAVILVYTTELYWLQWILTMPVYALTPVFLWYIWRHHFETEPELKTLVILYLVNVVLMSALFISFNAYNNAFWFISSMLIAFVYMGFLMYQFIMLGAKSRPGSILRMLYFMMILISGAYILTQSEPFNTQILLEGSDFAKLMTAYFIEPIHIIFLATLVFFQFLKFESQTNK
jgi:hypothetical protein